MHESKNGVKENKIAETKLSQSAKGERTWERDCSLFRSVHYLYRIDLL